MIKKNQQAREALEPKDQNVNIPQSQQEQFKKSTPKSHRKFSSSQTYKNKSFYSKQKSQIPNLIQAQQRQKQIVKFHNRNFYQRQKRLEQIFKQNCRIYIQLNKQKSYYSKNFLKSEEKKLKKSHNVSYSEYNTTKIFEHQKLQNFLQNNYFPSSNHKLERRYSLSLTRPKKQPQLQQKKKQLCLGNNLQSDFVIDLKRYQKNKTEMIPRKNHKPNLQNVKDLYSFIQNKSNRNNELASVKNPVYISFKRRPNSGFRC